MGSGRGSEMGKILKKLKSLLTRKKKRVRKKK